MRIWRLLRSLYPESFREAYGEQMLELLDERAREVLDQRGRLAWFGFLLRNTADLLRSAVLEQRAWRQIRSRSARQSPGSLRLWSRTADFLGEVGIALRRFAKSPGFTCVAVLLLALGIGANSTIFAVLNAVVLRPLSYEEPDRLVRVWESNPAQGWDLFSYSHPNYLDHRDRNRTFSDLAAFADEGYNFTGDGNPIQLLGGRVTHDLYPMLGIEPILGRLFSAEEDAPGERGQVVVLSHGMWLSHFGGDPEVVGQVMVLSGVPYTVIGVLPRGSQWIDYWDVVTPLNPQPDRHRDDHRLGVVARLAPGVSAQQAEADLDTIAASLAEQFPESNTGFDTRVIGLHESIVGPETRTALYMLMGAVVFVLLIAATNLASLLMARSSARQRELALAVALGSSTLR